MEGSISIVLQTCVRAPELVVSQAHHAAIPRYHLRDRPHTHAASTPLTERESDDDQDENDPFMNYVELRVMETRAAILFVREASRVDGNQVLLLKVDETWWGAADDKKDRTQNDVYLRPDQHESAFRALRNALAFQPRVRRRLGVAVDSSVGALFGPSPSTRVVYFAKMLAYHLTSILHTLDREDGAKAGGGGFLSTISFFLFDLREGGLDDEGGWWLTEAVMRRVRLSCRRGGQTTAFSAHPTDQQPAHLDGFLRSLQNVLLSGNRLRIAGAVMILQSLIGFEAPPREWPVDAANSAPEKAAEGPFHDPPRPRRLLPYLRLIDLRWNDLTIAETGQFLAPMMAGFEGDAPVLVASLDGAQNRAKAPGPGRLNLALTPRSSSGEEKSAGADFSPAPRPVRAASRETSPTPSRESRRNRGYFDKKWWRASDGDDSTDKSPAVPRFRLHDDGKEGKDAGGKGRPRDSDPFFLSTTQRPRAGGKGAVLGREAAAAAKTNGGGSPAEPTIERRAVQTPRRGEIDEEKTLLLSPLPSAPFIAERERSLSNNLSGLMMELSLEDSAMRARPSARCRSQNSDRNIRHSNPNRDSYDILTVDAIMESGKPLPPSTRGNSIVVSSASLSYLKVSPSTVRSALTTPREPYYHGSSRTEESNGSRRRQSGEKNTQNNNNSGDNSGASRRLLWATSPRREPHPQLSTVATINANPLRKDSALTKGSRASSSQRLFSIICFETPSSSFLSIPSPQAGRKRPRGIVSSSHSKKSPFKQEPKASLGAKRKRKRAGSRNKIIKAKPSSALIEATPLSCPFNGNLNQNKTNNAEKAPLLTWWPIPLIHRKLRTVRPSRIPQPLVKGTT